MKRSAWLVPAGIKPARRVEDFVNFIDLAPTILGAAGVDIPSGMTGSSLLDVLLSPASGRVDPKRSWTAAGLEWHGEADPINLAGRVIRDERYAYITDETGGTTEEVLLNTLPPRPVTAVPSRPARYIHEFFLPLYVHY